MKRGRPKLEENIEKPKKYKRVFEGEDCDTTWTYDENVTRNGPVRIDVKWHKTYKQFQQEVKQLKEIKRQQRKHKKQQQAKFFK